MLRQVWPAFDDKRQIGVLGGGCGVFGALRASDFASPPFKFVVFDGASEECSSPTRPNAVT